MKLIFQVISLTSTFFFGCSNRQTAQEPALTTIQSQKMADFKFIFQSAHPKAQALMADAFYWSPVEETAPFGSDDGSDAAYGFRQWRQVNKTESPVNYLKDLIEGWQYPYFDYNEMDTSVIKAYISSKANPDEAAIEERMRMMKELFKNSPDSAMNNLDDKKMKEIILLSAKEMGGSYLTGQDNAIIGTGFAQFVLEGHIDNDIKSLTIIAIKRQLLPLLINRYDEDYRGKRKEQLMKMLTVVSKAN